MSSPASRPALYTAEEGWKPLQHLGHGHRQLRPQRRRLPRIFPDQHGRQQAADADRRADGRRAEADFKDVAFAKGVTAHRPYTGDDLQPSTGWHAQFEDVNNDGLVDLFVAKGNVDEMPDFAQQDPNNLLLQASRRQVRRSRRQGGRRQHGNLARRALRRLQPRRPARSRRGEPQHGAQFWRNTSAERRPLARGQAAAAGANRDAIGAWIEVKSRRRVMRREITVGGGHASGQSAGGISGSATMTEARCG